jgi:protocatechuate 3,4-dioxygenase beta subunit
VEDAPSTRRSALLRAGALLAGALGVGGWKAATSGEVTCVLMPEQTEGPYYIDGEKLRRNIAEGRPGTPLELRATVVNASTCKPIRNAVVDIWHCDAGGVYSGFGNAASNRTFMRGLQRTNAKGVAVFRTVYPGWYPGRTVHIHVKVHVGGNVLHTGQLYFPDSVTDAVYRKAPYSRRPNRNTRNPDDAIYRNGGKRSQVKVRKNPGLYVASITMGVTR